MRSLNRQVSAHYNRNTKSHTAASMQSNAPGISQRMRARQRNTGILGGYRAEPTFEIITGWVVEFAGPWGNVIGLTDYVKDRAKARPASQQANR